jgi:geranylgeranyl diphosphate synthase type I
MSPKLTSTNNIVSILLPAIEQALIHALEPSKGHEYQELYEMMAYHMGWLNEEGEPIPRGKRVRPLLLLLTTAASRGRWENALSAAAAVELIHNFSLIHDDIEDQSETRRGRLALWVKWGIPQAINTGDAMFILAHLSMVNLAQSLTPSITIEASRILQETCLQ